MKKEKKEDIRFVCPKCKKEYKHYGWYKRHCLMKHSAILPHITKKVVEKRDIDRIFTKIDSLENKIDLILNGSVHDIDIKKIKKPEVSMPITPEQISMTQCVNELKTIFSEGLNVLGKMEDLDVGIKSEEEIKHLEIEAFVRSLKRNNKHIEVEE